MLNHFVIRFDRNLSYFLIFAFTSGALAHCLPAVLPVTKLTTDGLLFVINSLVLYAIYRTNQDRRLFSWLIIAYAFTFAMEAIGVATGAIFGEYHYGPTMWFQWLGVPFVIALNWCVLTLACNEIACWVLERLFPDTKNITSTSPPSSPLSPGATISTQILPSLRSSNVKLQLPAKNIEFANEHDQKVTPSPVGRGEGLSGLPEMCENRSSPGERPYPISHIPYRISLITLAAILTALYDVTIEPVAIALDYWQWHAGEIPLQNYLAWAAIAFLISLPLYVFNVRFRSPVLRVYFFAQLFFFAVLNFML